MTHTPVTIRRATPHDAALIAELGARTFAETFGPDNTEADMASYLASSFGPELQAAEIADSSTAFLIAEVAGAGGAGAGGAGAGGPATGGQTAPATAGYARLRLSEAPACVLGTRPLEIARLYADRPWLGRGVGAALMASALEYADTESCDVIWLDVWERNPRAIAFYERWGFAVVGTQSFTLGEDVQNDLIMARAAK